MAAFNSPDGWAVKRLAVGAALFIVYFIHYLFLLFGLTDKVKLPALEIL